MKQALQAVAVSPELLSQWQHMAEKPFQENLKDGRIFEREMHTPSGTVTRITFLDSQKKTAGEIEFFVEEGSLVVGSMEMPEGAWNPDIAHALFAKALLAHPEVERIEVSSQPGDKDTYSKAVGRQVPEEAALMETQTYQVAKALGFGKIVWKSEAEPLGTDVAPRGRDHSIQLMLERGP